MTMTPSVKAASLVVALAATAAGVCFRAAPGEAAPGQAPVPTAADRAERVPVVQARRGAWRVTVPVRGVLESSNNADAYCRVEGRTRIIIILPEGTKVKKGDQVCELDASELRDRLTDQQIVTRGAESAYRQAKLDRELAGEAVGAYIDGTYPIEVQTITGQASSCREAVAAAQSRLDRTRAARKRAEEAAPPGTTLRAADVVASADLDDRIEDAELTLARGRRDLALAEARIGVLEKFAKPRMLKRLKSEIDQRDTDELARKAAWDIEMSKEKKLRNQIENCKIVAPAGGMVVYASVSPDGDRIGEGATVRERQKIFSVPDLKAFQMTVHIPESKIARIVPKQNVRVSVDAFAQADFVGRVVDINPLPDPLSDDAPGARTYAARVQVDEPLPGFRPGMTGSAEIAVEDRKDIVSVPVGAVVRSDGRDQVAVKTVDGFVWRDVTLGSTDGTLVEVKDGLDGGELVSFEPAKHLAEMSPPAK